MFLNTKCLLFILIINIKTSVTANYTGYTLYNVIPTTKSQLLFLRKIIRNDFIGIRFWTKSVKLYQSSQILVGPDDKKLFLKKVDDFGFDIEVLLLDVQKAFYHQKFKKRFTRQNSHSFSLDTYHNWEEICQWLNDLASIHSDISNIIKIGSTFEGRDILTFNINRPSAKKSIIVECGIHGNEWVTVEFCVYLIKSILTPEKENDVILATIAYDYNWHIIPVLNPDGFVFSHKVDRLWRKNRKSYISGTGVDLDRNFDSNFCKFDGSVIPYKDNYCGSKPFSEEESKALATFVANCTDLVAYFAIRSYGQKIEIPYGDRTKHLSNYNIMENYAKQAVLRMYEYSKFKHKYAVGTTYDLTGIRISGDTASWVKKTFETPYVFTFYLGDNGTFGHALPPKEIEPICKESLLGFSQILAATPKYLPENIYGDDACDLRGNCNLLLFVCCLLHLLWSNLNTLLSW